MVYPYLIKIMTESLGVKGTLLILGGISLNAIPLAVLWSDPKYRSLSKYVTDSTVNDARQSLPDEEKRNKKNVSDINKITTDNHSAKDDNSEFQILLTGSNDNDGDHTCMNDNTNSESGEKDKKGRSNYKKTDASSRVKSHSEGIVAKFLNTLTYIPFSVLICAFACAMPALLTFEILFLDVLETSGLSRDSGITLIIIMNGVCIPARIFPGLIHKIPRCSSSLGMIIGPLVSMTGILLLNLASGFAGSYQYF